MLTSPQLLQSAAAVSAASSIGTQTSLRLVTTAEEAVALCVVVDDAWQSYMENFYPNHMPMVSILEQSMMKAAQQKRLFAIQQDGVDVGCVACGMVDEALAKQVQLPATIKPTDVALIEMFYLLPQARKQGVGHSTMQQLMLRWQQQSASSSPCMLAICHPDNHKAIEFFKRYAVVSEQLIDAPSPTYRDASMNVPKWYLLLKISD